MPILHHPACTHPADETVLCRFIDFPKFRDLLANEELYLRRTDLFKETDPQEALAPDEYVRATLRLQRYGLRDELQLNNQQAFARQNSEAYFINCWQVFEGETLNMWQTYGQGVAIFSRFDLLKAALDPMLDKILLGVVRYGEKDMEGYNLIQFLYTKRRNFEKERELRIVLQCYDPMAGVNRHWDAENFPHREPLDDVNALHDWVHPFKRRRIDVNRVVTQIRLSPWATTDGLAEVKLWVKNKNLACSVRSSELASAYTPTLEELRKSRG